MLFLFSNLAFVKITVDLKQDGTCQDGDMCGAYEREGRTGFPTIHYSNETSTSGARGFSTCKCDSGVLVHYYIASTIIMLK